jgi:hypothetical protein
MDIVGGIFSILLVCVFGYFIYKDNTKHENVSEIICTTKFKGKTYSKETGYCIVDDSSYVSKRVIDSVINSEGVK